jgi:biotin carboxyl carrier protein
MEINGNSLLWIDLNGVSKIKVKAHGGVQLALDITELEYVTELPLLVDTRIPGAYGFADLNAALQLYPTLHGKIEGVTSEDKSHAVTGFAPPAASIIRGTARRTFTLPYTGRIYVSEGDRVQPDKVLGENLYDPPRLYVLQVFRGSEKLYSEEHFRKFLLVKPQDEVRLDQLIYKEELSIMGSLLSTGVNHYYSPVRGRVERIDWANGALLLREIQDYSFEPVVINLAELLGVKPGVVMGLMRKRIGDFVHTGEVLAAKGKTKMEHSVRTPTTGTIQSYDPHTGQLTITYVKKDLSLKASLTAIVTKVSAKRYVELEYEGSTLNGSIGFGRVSAGKLVYLEAWDAAAVTEDAIMAYPFALSAEQMQVLKIKKVGGLIVPSLPQKEMVTLLGQEIGVGITGNEHLPFAILLISGFGKLPLPAAIVSELKIHNGKHTVLLPATQIRAGVVRPVLIIQ